LDADGRGGSQNFTVKLEAGKGSAITSLVVDCRGNVKIADNPPRKPPGYLLGSLKRSNTTFRIERKGKELRVWLRDELADAISLDDILCYDQVQIGLTGTPPEWVYETARLYRIKFRTLAPPRAPTEQSR
jgi:hypothetical protein